MASTKIRGITIELGADTSGLKKALSGVNSDIKSTQKQLKDVERLLKLDPTNTELLAQKQRLLGDEVKKTADKLDVLKEAQKKVGEELEKTGKGQEQYDALSREIASTELYLKDAEAAAKSFNATTAKISATAGKISDKFGDLAQKTRGLSLAAGGALVGLGGLAVKAAKDADDLNTLAKQTGLTTEELQKMQYASDLIDVDVDTITGSMRKMKKSIDTNSKAFEKIGVSVKKTNGQFKGASEIFYETVAALGQIDDETERDIVAMDIFGKSADELAGILDDGGASLRALGKEAEEMGVIIPQEDIDAANEFNDSLDKLKAQGMATLAQVGGQIAEMILPYIPEIQAGIERVLSVLREMDPSLLKIIAGVLAVTAALSPMFSVVSGVSGAISTLTGSAGALSGAFAGISAPILGVVAVVGVLVAAFMTLWNTNDEFRDHVTSVWDEVGAKFNEFGDGIVSRLNEMGYNFNNFSEVVSAAWTAFSEMLAPVFLNAIDLIAEQFEAFLDMLTGFVDIYGGIINKDWSQIWLGCKEVFGSIWDGIVSMLKAYINSMIGLINGIIGGVNKIGVGEHKINIPLIPMLADGGVLTSGSAIVGERGAELLTVSNGAAMVEPLNGQSSELTALLETYLPYLAAGTQLVMDSGALVGSIAPDMNAALGTIAIRGGKR